MSDDTPSAEAPPPETRAHRLKRLRMRSWRRGTKEMDMILGPFADRALDALSETELDLYEALLAEADTDLYRWFSGQDEMPARYRSLARRIAAASGFTMNGGADAP